MVNSIGRGHQSKKSMVTASAEETEAFGQDFAKQLQAGDVVAFFGELGSGKTTMIRGICREFGIERGVKSPSFVYMRRYATQITIYHFDFYRLSPEDDMVNLELNEYLYGEGIVLLEWAERVQGMLPATHYEVRLTILSENKREIVVTYVGKDGNEETQ